MFDIQIEETLNEGLEDLLNQVAKEDYEEEAEALAIIDLYMEEEEWASTMMATKDML